MDNYPLVFRSKYFYLLLSMMGYFLISPFLIEDQLHKTVLSILISLVVVLCINVIARNTYLFIASLILGGISITTHWIINLVADHHLVILIHFCSILLFLLIMTCYVISSVAKHRTITKDTLFGAVCGYFLLGITWGEMFTLIHCINPNAFSFHTPLTSIRDLSQHFLYFSFETVTTLGYGDILPLSDVARTFAWLEAVTGQVYLAVWISQLVGLRIVQMTKMQIK